MWRRSWWEAERVVCEKVAVSIFRSLPPTEGGGRGWKGGLLEVGWNGCVRH